MMMGMFASCIAWFESHKVLREWPFEKVTTAEFGNQVTSSRKVLQHEVSVNQPNIWVVSQCGMPNKIIRDSKILSILNIENLSRGDYRAQYFLDILTLRRFSILISNMLGNAVALAEN